MSSLAVPRIGNVNVLVGDEMTIALDVQFVKA